MCLYKPVQVTDNNNKTLAYYRIRPFSMQYESAMLYSKGTYSQHFISFATYEQSQ